MRCVLIVALVFTLGGCATVTEFCVEREQPDRSGTTTVHICGKPA